MHADKIMCAKAAVLICGSAHISQCEFQCFLPEKKHNLIHLFYYTKSLLWPDSFFSVCYRGFFGLLHTLLASVFFLNIFYSWLSRLFNPNCASNIKCKNVTAGGLFPLKQRSLAALWNAQMCVVITPQVGATLARGECGRWRVVKKGRRYMCEKSPQTSCQAREHVGTRVSASRFRIRTRVVQFKSMCLLFLCAVFPSLALKLKNCIY